MGEISPMCMHCGASQEERWVLMCEECKARAARGVCPTLCDDDCDAWCHETHQVWPKWLHDTNKCPGKPADAEIWYPEGFDESQTSYSKFAARHG